MLVAAATAAGVALLGWWAEGVWPLVMVLVACPAALALLGSSKPGALSAGIGAAFGAMAAYWLFAKRLISEMPSVEWLNLDALIVGVALFGLGMIGGAFAYASDHPPADVSALQLAETVTKRIAPGMLVFGAVLTFMLGADAARPIVGNLGTGIVSMAVALGAGLMTGKRIGPFMRKSAGVQHRDYGA
jgi:hypothetical protein